MVHSVSLQVGGACAGTAPPHLYNTPSVSAASCLDCQSPGLLPPSSRRWRSSGGCQARLAAAPPLPSSTPAGQFLDCGRDEPAPSDCTAVQLPPPCCRSEHIWRKDVNLQHLCGTRLCSKYLTRFHLSGLNRITAVFPGCREPVSPSSHENGGGG